MCVCLERQAFFGVVSLLIDPKTLPPGTRITEDNYEQFVPDKHRTVVDRLKRYASYLSLCCRSY